MDGVEEADFLCPSGCRAWKEAKSDRCCQREEQSSRVPENLWVYKLCQALAACLWVISHFLHLLL